VNDMVGKITAALDAAEARREAVTESWEIAESYDDPPDDVYVVGLDAYFRIADADLIVSVVNREARQIRHARALLEMATDLQDKSLTQTANYIGHALIKGLASTWCPEAAS
jgi:hypothetical protein